MGPRLITRREKVCEALSLMSEAVGPMFVMTLLHKRAAANKNPKVVMRWASDWHMAASLHGNPEHKCCS